MASYKEIVTKAVVGKGRKSFSSNHVMIPSISPTTILGCWVINHNFKGEKINNEVLINGSFDVNIWYSSQNNTNTDVIKDTISYSERIKVKMNDDNYDGNDEIIVRTIKQPNCIKAEIVDGTIKYVIEKELSAEVVGDAKIRVGINEEDTDWYDDTDSIENEINETVNENFL